MPSTRLRAATLTAKEGQMPTACYCPSRILRLAIFLPAALCLFAAPALAQAPIGVRTGNHDGYGRLVFDFPDLVDYRLAQEPGLVVLHFAETEPIGEPRWLPHNVIAFSADPGEASIGIVPGATIRMMRLGTRVVLDVLDPRAAGAAPATPPLPLPPIPEPAATASAPALAPSVPGGQQPSLVARSTSDKASLIPSEVEASDVPAAPASAPPVAASASTTTSAAPAAPPTTPGVPPPAPPAATPAPATAAYADPLALAARLVPPPADARAAFLLPFAPETGAAAFRRGNAGYVVFDESRPVDMAALVANPLLAAARVTLLPEGTLLRVPLPPTLRLDLSHRDEGWVVAITPAPSTAHAITSRTAAGSLVLPLVSAARVVVMPDPLSGANLLIGTAHVPGAAVAVTRQMPGFVLLHTWLGVAVEPLTDRLALRPDARGFAIITEAPGGLPLPATPAHLAALESAATLTRRFDFPPLPLAVLARRLQQELDATVTAPPLARFASRLAEANTLVALGMGPEAEALLNLAVADDPRHAADADVQGLSAIAALLAGRLDQSTGLADPGLSGSDEIALWRAVRAQLLGQDPAGTAPVFAATGALILAYPAPLKAFLAPIAAEALVQGGELAAASQFLARAPTTPPLDFARAMLLAAQGRKTDALAAYDKLTGSSNRRVAARAASHAVLLRLTMGKIDAAAAADALDRQFYAWRGGEHEIRLRIEVAHLRAQAGEWRQALELLRRTQKLFPAASQVAAARADTFARLFEGKTAEQLTPFDIVTLIEDNADLIPPGPAGEKLGELLADRLLALDLPERAAPVLEKLMQAAPPGEPQAALGARLAEVRLGMNDPAGALAALAASRAADLPLALAEKRTLIYARAIAAQGRPDQALAALGAFSDAPALRLSAQLLEQTKDWAGAEAAFTALAGIEVPASGPLSDAAKSTLVHLATNATQASDTAELLRLHSDYAARMGQGPLADMFHLLTDPPARSAADLPEVRQQTTIAERLPEELQAIGATMRVVP